MPVFYKRGAVLRIRFHPPDDSGHPIEKFCICLQEGKIVQNTNAFVGIILTTRYLDRLHKTDVFITPEESHSEKGVKAICSQIHTIPKDRVIDYAYSLSTGTMGEIDQKLLFGIGIVRLEDYDEF